MWNVLKGCCHLLIIFSTEWFQCLKEVLWVWHVTKIMEVVCIVESWIINGAWYSLGCSGCFFVAIALPSFQCCLWDQLWQHLSCCASSRDCLMVAIKNCGKLTKLMKLYLDQFYCYFLQIFVIKWMRIVAMCVNHRNFFLLCWYILWNLFLTQLYDGLMISGGNSYTGTSSASTGSLLLTRLLTRCGHPEEIFWSKWGV